MNRGLVLEALVAALLFGLFLWWVALNGLTTHPILCGGVVLAVMVLLFVVVVRRHTGGR